MEIEVKKDRKEINKIIENCLPLMKLNKAMTRECADAIMVYFIEKTPNKPKIDKSKLGYGRSYGYPTPSKPNKNNG